MDKNLPIITVTNKVKVNVVQNFQDRIICFNFYTFVNHLII